MRIAVLIDVHANLPALQAALAAIREADCDAIYHTGDAVAIGPYPAECLDLLLHTPTVRFVMGNHDAGFAFGLPHTRPSSMSERVFDHQRWTHAQLDPALRSDVAGWPYAIDEEIEGLQVHFVHYALDKTGRGWQGLRPDPKPTDLDEAFGSGPDLVCFGHDHARRDIIGRARYLNPGALGCSVESLARFVVVEIADGRSAVTLRAVPYDDMWLIREFARRDVPGRDFILRTFFGHG